MSLAKNEQLRPNGLSLEEVGRKLGYSDRTIKVIQKQALAKSLYYKNNFLKCL